MTMLGVAEGVQGTPSKLNICRGRAGPNVITGANRHLDSIGSRGPGLRTP